MEDKKFEDFCKSAVPAFFSLVCFVILIAILILFGSCDNKYKRENERLREELARVQQYVPLDRDTIHDSVEVITQKVVEIEKIKEVLSKEDRQLIKDLGMKVQELEAMMKTGMETRDSVQLSAVIQQNTGRDSIRDSILRYRDAWTEIVYDERNRRMAYTVKDSLAVAVKREYKYRFLWWKWHVKGYEVKVVNFNPHARINYNSVVKRKE